MKKQHISLLLGLFFLCISVIFAVIVVHQKTELPSHAAGTTPVSMPLLSRNLPVFASSSVSPATNANDADYSTSWRSSGPGWIAFNVSSIPSTQRSNVVFAWYNDDTGPYDHTVINDPAYNIPGSYTIEANTSTSSTTPSIGWVSLATVSNNTYHSRQHVLNLASYTWVRMNITAIDGSSQNMDASINIDMFNGSQGITDDWIFYGDSITQGSMGHTTAGGAGSFSQLIQAQNASYFPLQENGGIGYLLSADGASHINTWLSIFPGTYVTLNYGTNDAWNCVDPTTFYNNYVTMVQAIITAGKIPVIPHIPWSTVAAIQQCAPALNAKIDQLKQAFPQIISGPDLWQIFLNKGNLLVDGVHPNDQGTALYRQSWANAMIANVYTAASATSTPTSTPSSTGGATTFSALHVSGSQVVNAQNQRVHLHGVDHSGTEYACIQGWGFFDTPDGNMPNIAAMKSWNINSVMVLLNEDCWLGINGVPAAYGGTNYQNAIKNYVNQLLANGIFPIVSMMWTAPGTTQALDHATMSNMDHTPTAWTSIANTFKGDNRIMFRLLQEPHPSAGNSTAGWNCWLNGGANGQNGCNEGFTAAGMQTLMNTIRNTGATNIVWVSGVDYANSFDQFLTHKPNDPLQNMGAMADVYMDVNPCRTTTCWNTYYKPIITAGIPFMAGEFGEGVNGVCSVTNSNIFMDWMDANGAAGYEAWNWNTWGTSCSDLSLITDFNGTAHSPNGTNYKTRLATLGTAVTPPVGSATPTPIPATPVVMPTPQAGTVTIDDSIIGTGLNQFNYLGSGWGHCSACTNGYQTTTSYSSTTADTVTLQFTGTQIVYYGEKDTHHGIGAVSIDGGAETMIDTYSSTRLENQALWTSPVLASGTHTFKLRITGNKNSSSTDITVPIDRVDILTTTAFNTPTPTLKSTNTPTPTTAASTKVAVILKIHGLGQGGDSVNASSVGNTSPRHLTRTATIMLTNTANTTLPGKSGTVMYQASTGDFRGIIDVGTIASGPYIGKITMPGSLPAAVPGFINIVSGQTATLPVVSLVVGDVNQDGKIDILDYNMELDCYSDFAPARNCDATKKLQTDISDDGNVNSSDLNLFLREMSVRS